MEFSTLIYNAFVYGIIFEFIKFVIHNIVIYIINKITKSGQSGANVMDTFNDMSKLFMNIQNPIKNRK